MARLLRLLIAVAAAAGIAGAGIALANTDPASDVLIVQNVFVPYNPQVCSQVQGALKKATGKTKEAGYPLKVAVIGSESDLGGAPELFGRPSEYAKFLGQELTSFKTHGRRGREAVVPLLVVMPQGFGFSQVAAPAREAVKGITIQRSPDSNTLARAAVKAVPKIATAAGHPVAAVKVPSGCSHKSSTVLLFGVPIVLLVIAGLLIHLRKPPQEAGDSV